MIEWHKYTSPSQVKHLALVVPDGRIPLDFLMQQNKERRGTEFHGFMRLPAELRIMIYKSLLITDIFAVPAMYRRGEPRLQIPNGVTTGLFLGVSKQVQSEAEAVFFNGNDFLIPEELWRVPDIFSPSRLATKAHRQQLTQVYSWPFNACTCVSKLYFSS